MTSDSGSRLVVAVDIGSTHASYAFSFHHDFLKDPLKIRTTAWAGHRDLFTPKAPTVVLLSRTLELVTFGYAAEDTYAEMVLYEEEEDGSRLFRDIVKQLVAYTTGMNDWKNCRMKDTEGRMAPVLKVFSAVFQYFRQHLDNVLSTTGVDLLGNVVTWVVTVAPSWNAVARECITGAAMESGIPKENIVLAIEPEVALLHHCTLTKHDAIFLQGTRTLVLDLGGGGTELSVYEVTSTGSLTERYHAHCGGDLASGVVDSNFVTLLNEITDGCFKDKFRHNCLTDYYDMMREFEAKKRLVGQNGADKLTFAVPISLEQLVLDETGISLKDTIGITGFANNVTYSKSKIRIDTTAISALFVELLESIQKKIREVRAQQPFDKIFMVGGFAECSLVASAMQEAFPNTIVTCPDAGMAVLKGSVLYGHNDKQLKFINPAVTNSNHTSADVNTQRSSVGKSPATRTTCTNVKVNAGLAGELMDRRSPRPRKHKKSRACAIL